MYPLLCSGGFPNPEKNGILTVVGAQAIPIVPGSPVDCQLRDDNVSGAPASNTYREIVHLKSDGNSSPSITFDEPLKTRKGIRATTLTNCICILYTR